MAQKGQPSNNLKSQERRTESRERGAQPIPDFTIRASNHQSVECFCYNVEYIVFF